MKKTFIAAAVIVCTAMSLFCYAGETNARLSRDIVRLHILANSDSETDQALKLKVRDRILKETNASVSKEDIPKMLEKYRLAALSEIRENGYAYDVTAEYGKFHFPTKEYGSLTYPAGDYDAVRIKIGRGEGRNWWCVLFPPLCYVNEAVDSEKTLAELKKMLSPEDYALITSSEDGPVPVKVKFKIVEIINNLKEKVINANENKSKSSKPA